jgi:hypothetical protein
VSADSPTCVRCTQQNLECVYGVSQRRGKPFQPYPKSKPANVARNADIGEEQQTPDNSNSKSDTGARNVDHGEEQQNLDNSSITNKDKTYPWPNTGWNLSDVGPEIDFSLVSHIPNDNIELTLPLNHDMCGVMSILRLHLAKVEKLLNSTCGSDIPKSVADQYLTEFRIIRATIQQLLICKCYTCHQDSAIMFLLATLSSSLIESCRSLVTNLMMALAAAWNNSSKIADLTTFASSLQPELDQFKEICHLIRERTSRHSRAKAVGEAFYEMLCGQGESFSDLLNTFLANSAARSDRLQHTISVSC